MKTTITLTALAVLLLAGGLRADTVYLKGGGTLRGEVMELKEAALIMSLEGLEGSRVEVPFSRISDYGLYEVKRARIDVKSAAAREEFGDWALERGMFTFAMDEYRAAAEIAGAKATPRLKKKLADASSRCGADKLARGKELIEQGDLIGARRFFMDILENHPSCPAAGVAKEQVARIGTEFSARRSQAAEAKHTERSRQGVEHGLKTVIDLIEKGDRMRRLGLQDSGSLGRAENDFESAISSYERAKTVLGKVGKLPAAATRAAELTSLRSTIDARLGDVYVDIGHNHIVKGNLVKANHYMGLALALDPNNPKALGLRQSIAVASANDNWGRPSGYR